MFTCPKKFLLFVALFLLAVTACGCSAPRLSQSNVEIQVTLNVDGQAKKVQARLGENVQKILEAENITLSSLDRVEPQPYTIISEGLSIRVIRGKEVFETQQSVIPFERQKVENESLPFGETRLIQPGSNGKKEVVYRYFYEDDTLAGTSISRINILEDPLPEIIMVGVQTPFTPLPIPGKIIGLSGGNAWMLHTSTSKRTPLISTGDLDGRVFSLSNDGKWLLFTRKSSQPADVEINTLWAINIDDPQAAPLDLKTSNVIHFADWDPTTFSTLRILYSTVEPRSSSPGWQANNDLYRMVVASNGNLGVREKIIDANTGGIYGWWGTNYIWAPSGKLLAYSRPDGIGIVSFKNKTLLPQLSITPLQTHSDWALIPGLAWGADSSTIYVVTHSAPMGLTNPEESNVFDLSMISLNSDLNLRLVEQSGMFAYPSASSLRQNGNESSYYVAFLQSLNPAQSGTSGYELVIMDRDGSNRKKVFPPPASTGLSPQTPVWAPAPLSTGEGDFIAVVYQGNLWLIDAATGEQHQITGDGLIQKIIWK